MQEGNERKRKRLEELEALAAEQDEKGLFRDVDDALAPVADDIAEAVVPPAEQLAELDLIGDDNPGTPRWHVTAAGETVTAIAVSEPEPRLYGFDPSGAIVATRMREDGRYEHAMLDETGLPIEWRTAPRPKLN